MRELLRSTCRTNRACHDIITRTAVVWPLSWTGQLRKKPGESREDGIDERGGERERERESEIERERDR